MPVEGEPLYRSREDIYADMAAEAMSRVPDVFLGEEGNLRMLLEIIAGVGESVFLANQIVSDDGFIATANPAALDRHGDERGVPRKDGTPAVGNLLISGQGGTSVPTETEVAYDPGTGTDPLYFVTTALALIPNPGIPTAPVTIDGGAGPLPAGTYEFAVSFQTAAGETVIGPPSNALTIAANRLISIGSVPFGGPGTIARNLYQRFNGGAWQKIMDAAQVAWFANNTQTGTNMGISSLGAAPLDVSTAEAISIPAQSETNGADYNLLTGTITILTTAPDGVTAVTNPAPFTGGSDPEATEDYRVRLLNAARSGGTGSPTDLKSWAEAVDGVESATVFANDNVGVAAPGHVTVRISGVGGAIPSAGLITTVLDTLNLKDIANMTIHVASFTALSTNVSVTTTISAGYVLADVSPAVTRAISDYINGLQVGETLRVSGIVDAVFGLPGVDDVVVTTPASNQTTAATSKRTVGTITVS